MKLLCASTSIGFIQSLRIALEGEGIECFCSDSDRVFSSVAGPMLGSAARLYVLHEADWPEAVRLLGELAPPAPSKPGHTGPERTLPRWLSLMLVATAAAVIAAVLGSSQ